MPWTDQFTIYKVSLHFLIWAWVFSGLPQNCASCLLWNHFAMLVRVLRLVPHAFVTSFYNKLPMVWCFCLMLTYLGSALAYVLVSRAWAQAACRNRNAKKPFKSRLESSGTPLLYQVAVKVLRPNMEPVLRGCDSSSEVVARFSFHIANHCLDYHGDCHFWVFSFPKLGNVQVTLPTWSCLL